MRAPGFWYRPQGVASTVLKPLGALYGAGTRRALTKGPRARLEVPVICVGNINVGGTGKTPTVLAILQRLSAMGATPHVVTRGYGGDLEGPEQVEEKMHTPSQTGDEPLLLAPFAPVWVAKDRAAGARAAAKAGASIIVLDDGFQNAALHYDLAIVVVDVARGFGNGCVLPAGPLREPVDIGLARADALVRIGAEKAQRDFDVRWPQAKALPSLRAQLVPVETGMDWANTRVFAFAGIGDPEKFFATLRGLGADLVGTRALDDHQPLERGLVQRLMAEAKTQNAQLVTTEKDAVRLPPEFRREVLSLPVRLEFETPGAVQALLKPLV